MFLMEGKWSDFKNSMSIAKICRWYQINVADGIGGFCAEIKQLVG